MQMRSIESFQPADDPELNAAIDDILARAQRNGTTLTRDGLTFILTQERELRALHSVIELILAGKVNARLGDTGDLLKPGDYLFSATGDEEDSDGGES